MNEGWRFDVTFLFSYSFPLMKKTKNLGRAFGLTKLDLLTR